MSAQVLRKTFGGAALAASLAIAGGSAVAVSANGATASHQDAGSGDNNRGDVWLQDETAFPGHQNEPHLNCGTIYVYGSDLADATGALTIDSWPPTGSQTPVTGFIDRSYTYDVASRGNQIIFQFQAQALVDAATAMGAAPVNQNGLHFKLDVNQGETTTTEAGRDSNDEQKHKVFWINCPASGGGGGVGGVTVTPAPTAATPAPTPVSTPSPESTPVPTAAATPVATAAATPSSQVSGSGVQGVTDTAPSTPIGSGVGAGSVNAATAPDVTGAVQAASTTATTPDTGAAIGFGLAALLMAMGAYAFRLRRTESLNS